MACSEDRIVAAPNVTDLAAMLADNTRSAIIDVLMDGKAYTLSEITQRLTVTPQTVSYHLHRMWAIGVVNQIKSGRHHYYRLASSELAATFESLSTVAPTKIEHRLSQRKSATAMTYCRSCYDHLAGKVAVSLLYALEERHFVIAHSDHRLEVLSAGKDFLKAELAIDPDSIDRTRRQNTVACLDWSERDFHLGGAWGHALFKGLLANAYVQQTPNSRIVTVSADGRQWFASKLALQLHG
ncbi:MULTISPECIES: ArsR/SmtB family transcription factor [Lacticaseibacillus]|uniref:Helix-turn-helix transcriptional regulator n=2 Tax=Lacticaseibacillus TaxID=2759736 RepID=A0AAN1F0V8_LACCA|nr:MULTISPECIES: helix-turn-helix transcriptional regulator [Lacticaseibacillus]ARY92761.1 hypothetical protein BGL52_13725 [Lacticaseibacillus casei]KAB1970214.1 helix-turn-helix transcriptional regulator [Lacticaseibacillus casei]WLV80662.1 helix-turn-helix transcriptional regulator [Lacticaseibacillus sp. NCIMB 15473]WNX24622.1 helix-turn-helix transcriptional regulator [Lacticaseibacillus casei]WNX27394.1 helix-turn-helix transcriptional regulator [Lacticaseibacillus casei]